MSLSMAVTAIATSSSSTSLALLNKLPHLLFDYHHSLTSIPTSHFTPKSKPTKFLKLKSHSPPLSLLFHSLLPRASASLDTDLPESEEEQEDDGVEERETESFEAGRLYVGNLPYSMTSSELTEVFGEAGRVVSVEIVYDRVTDRSRGFAFVTMGSVEEAKEAIRMFEGSFSIVRGARLSALRRAHGVSTWVRHNHFHEACASHASCDYHIRSSSKYRSDRRG